MLFKYKSPTARAYTIYDTEQLNDEQLAEMAEAIELERQKIRKRMKVSEEMPKKPVKKYKTL